MLDAPAAPRPRASVAETLTCDHVVGARGVALGKYPGTIRFVGTTAFASGQWIGVELDEAGLGKNGGSVQGIAYFKCAEKKGLFVRPSGFMAEQNKEAVPQGSEAVSSEGAAAAAAEKTKQAAAAGGGAPLALTPLPIVGTSTAQAAVGKKSQMAGSLLKVLVDVSQQLPPLPRVCILGGTAFKDPDSKPLVEAIAQGFKASLGSSVVVLTGGMAGVQQTFAEAVGSGMPAMVHLKPVGESSGFGVGKDLSAGANLEERIQVYGEIGQLYISIEGGSGVAKEATLAAARGAVVLPLKGTGGASAGNFDFPKGCLERPEFIKEDHWLAFTQLKAKPEAARDAIVAVVQELLDSNRLQGMLTKDSERLAAELGQAESPKASWKRRRSIDSLLSGSIIMKGQSEMQKAVTDSVSELVKLEAMVQSLSTKLESALSREAAARETIAKRAAPAAPIAADQNGDVPAKQDVEAWLGSTADRLEARLSDHIMKSVEEQMQAALLEPLRAMAQAAQEVRRAKPAKANRRASINLDVETAHS
eukprot:TRINITY_DN101043_c0_g1_i1.p1 TRINITY_DN101043_c0_g1~~TRINITY_DN101043_c0_g1_i1.p1  ORF type:complete len:533 (+),score=163.71 TRINITY_DN101043_c0_g1_i1:102-1700(+)